METELLEEADWPRLRRMRLAALKQDPPAFLSTYERELQFGERRWRTEFSRGSWTVLLDQREPIGLLGVTREPETPPDTCYLEYMWVRPEFRRAGNASALVMSVLGELKRAGITTVLLWVLDGNDAAARLYARLGFAFTGQRQPLPDNPTRHENLMQLGL